MNPRWQDLAADWYENCSDRAEAGITKVPGLWRPFTW